MLAFSLSCLFSFFSDCYLDAIFLRRSVGRWCFWQFFGLSVFVFVWVFLRLVHQALLLIWLIYAVGMFVSIILFRLMAFLRVVVVVEQLSDRRVVLWRPMLFFGLWRAKWLANHLWNIMGVDPIWLYLFFGEFFLSHGLFLVVLLLSLVILLMVDFLLTVGVMIIWWFYWFVGLCFVSLFFIFLHVICQCRIHCFLLFVFATLPTLWFLLLLF